MSSSARNDLRARLLSARPLKSRVLTLFGEEVEFRQFTVRQALELGKVPEKEQLAHILINHCFIPGTDELVFEEADKDVLLNWPADSWVQELTKTIEELSSIDKEEAVKN